MKIVVKAMGMADKVLGGKDGLVLTLEEPLTIKEILSTKLGVDPGAVMAVLVNGHYQKRDYVPREGDEIVLVPPLGG